MKKISSVSALLVLAGPVCLTIQLVAQNQKSAADAKQWVIEGNVKDASDGSPIPNTSIRPSGPVFVTSVNTDEKGHYVLKGSTAGTYLIYPVKEGYGGYGPDAKPRSLSILPGERVTGIDFKLHKGAVIAGRVLDSRGRPVQDVHVYAMIRAFGQQPPYTSLGDAVTDDRGEYRISDLRQGACLLSATIKELEPHQPPPASVIAAREARTGPRPVIYYPNATSSLGATPIYVRWGEERDGVDFKWPETDVYCVRGEDAPLAASAGVLNTALWISINQPDTHARIGYGHVTPGEEFEFCGLPSGSYSLMATNWNEAYNPIDEKTHGLVRRDFTIDKQDVSLGLVAPRPGVPFVGRVTVADGGSETTIPSGISVGLGLRNRAMFANERFWAPVDPTGDFSIPSVLPDEYGLHVAGLPQGWYVRAATQQGQDVLHGTVRPGSELDIVLGNDGPLVTSEVVDKDNNPVPDASVMITQKDAPAGQDILVRHSDQNGQFQITNGIAPGTYLLLAFTDLVEGEDGDPSIFSAHRTDATEATLAPQSASTVKLTARKAH